MDENLQLIQYKKKDMNKLYMPLLIICLLTLFSCEEKISNTYVKNYTLELSKDTILFNVGGGMKSVEILTNQESWEASYEDNIWFDAKEYRDADGYEMLTLKADSCTALENRKSVINFKAGPYQTKLHVVQIGNKPTIYLGRDILLLDKDTAVINLPCVSNIDFDIENTSNWVKAEKMTNEDNEEIIRLFVGTNSADERRDTILFKQTDGDHVTSLVIIQSGEFESYEPLDVDKVKGNKQIPVISGRASSTLADFNIENAFDGDHTSYFQSDWQEKTSPIEFFFKLDAGEDKLNYIIYYPSEESAEQSVKGLYIYYKQKDDTDFKTLNYKTLDQYEPTLIVLNTPLENVDSLKFKVMTTYGGEAVPSASCAEVEFYTTTVLYADIFTDNTCSELQAGVTMDQILNINDAFYQKIAKHLFHETYDYERIMNLSPIQVDRRVAKINNASLYEHASGIYFEANEEVLVFCGEHSGASPSLIVFDGLTKKEYTLMEGINKITPDKAGKVYINNSTDVKIHIPSGIYKGLYNKDNLSTVFDEEGLDGEVLDLVSEKFHILLPFSYAQEISTSLNDFERKLDSLAVAARIFYGVNEGSYKTQSPLGILLGVEGAETESLLSFTQTEVDSILTFKGAYNATMFSVLEKLGAAYEPYIGKVWGESGVSSKLFPLSYFYENNGLSIVKNNNYYASAIQDIIVNNVSYANVSSEWSKVVPLWQLYHYLKNAENIDDYYAQLSNKVKSQTKLNAYTTELRTYTNQITEEVYDDFFYKWNMGGKELTEPSKLGLAYYIEDNLSIYTGGGEFNPGRFFASTGLLYRYKNVVAVEVYNAGFLARVITDFSQTISKQWPSYSSSMKVKAVGASGISEEPI